MVCSNRGRACVALFAAGCGALVFGVCWLFSTTESSVALAYIPVTNEKAAHGTTVRNQPVVSKDEVLSRFSKEQHEGYMRRAIANSRKAGVEYKTGGAFGAVIVDRNGNVLSDGVNHVIGQNDPSWHAEVHAIRQACALLKKPKLEGCILYTSSEPCPMCLATAYWAGVDGIVYGATVADSTQYGNFSDGFIYEQLAKPVSQRAISEQTMLRPEAVEVWKEYAARQDKTDY